MRTTIALLLLAPLFAAAQTKDEKEVLASVQLLFDGMAGHSAEKLTAAMAADFQGVGIIDGQVRKITRDGFIQSNVNNKSAALERMWEPKVLIRGPIASVWAEYDYHRDGKFTHCGIDAFLLMKTAAGWQIFSIEYTMEREGCKPSPLGPPLA